MTKDPVKPDGVLTAGGALDRIVEARAKRLEETKRSRPIHQIAERLFEAASSRTVISTAEALSRKGRVNIIAEIKRRSPSRGIIREDFDPVRIAEQYVGGGAAALSILTEEDFFDGSLDYLSRIRPRAKVPLLRKDFIFDEYQVYESALAGADAILLIVAILDDGLLGRLIRVAGELKLDALVEVHTAEEMGRAARAGARIIGVNNRDLTTFKVDLQTSLRLAQLAPPGSILVSESGINTGSDIHQLKAAGYQAFLIGEHLMRAPDPGEALRLLLAQAESSEET